MSSPQGNTVPDFSRYAAVGDSITAGYADGALYYEGQQNAYANLLAGQLEAAGGGAFKQPLMSPGTAGVNQLGQARLCLERDAAYPKILRLAYAATTGDVEALQVNDYAREGPYNNLGVPGAKATTLVFPGFGNPAAGAGNYNPFFARMASNVTSASVLSDALLLAPTFFSVFVGNNDALAYALAGGMANPVTPPGGPAGQGFEGSLRTVIAALTADGAKGVIASLPSIANIPYFNILPSNGLLLHANEATALNGLYQDAGIHFYEGKNAFAVQDPAEPKGLRAAKNGELILMDLVLDMDSAAYLSGQKAIPKYYTLTPEEVQNVEAAILAYNNIIKTVAEENQLGFVDIHQLVKTARPDRHYNPISRSVDYDRRGVFSLDGLHPNAFGQALLANEFIKIINQHFGAAISLVEPRRFKGISFPH